MLSRLCQQTARPPLIAFVHWGTEYVTSPGKDQREITQQLGDCGIDVVVGAHGHRASPSITDVNIGVAQMTYSLGNFLFDQHSPIGSGSILEMRIFRQGTITTRLIPIPNLFDHANATAAATAQQWAKLKPA